MAEFTCTTDARGVATITWDVPGKSMNVLSLTGLAELDAHVDACLADPAVKGIVITSGKPDFAGGMDLNVIARMKADAGDDPARGLFEGIMKMHGVLRKIERAGIDPKSLTGGKPIAAALPGTALGIGYELPLACHRIFAAPNPKAKIGLPEIKVGIFPGAGGTTRLSRKLGPLQAAPFLLEGKLLDPKSAVSAQLIDELADDPVAAAAEWVLSNPDIVKPWDRKGWKLPGGAPYTPGGFMTFVGASAMVSGKTAGVYPAAKALLGAVYEGALVPFDTALRIEARAFVSVLMEPSSAAMIRTLFINKEALEKGARRPDVPPSTLTRLGVLGAGMMGAGIAQVAAQAGLDVVLIDATAEAAERGKAGIAKAFDKSVSRGKMTPEKRDAILARITATADYAALAGAELVVEAVFEDPAVKADVTARAEAVLAPDAIFATNTSTLPISDLARASARPERFIGIHFFSPVDKMLLVEIIKGRETGDAAVAMALDFVRRIRKTPIVVEDARFFYANRCIIPYINEGIRMIGEGVAPALIENAARMLGMPVGPLQLVDETSLELGVKIARATRAALGAAYPDDAVDAVIFPMAEAGRLGRKAGAGFYEYTDGKRTGLWEGVSDDWPRAPEQPDVHEVMDRLLYIQVLEALRALEQGVLRDIREGDVAAILGWGFAPWSGGPFSWVDRIGAKAALARCAALAARHGPRFAPPALLAEKAAQSESFYAA
ncbi:3-hydroxyacyl-CoA dehydrogenase NAD-binding domain-containing protein [Phaeovulum vinaykumarii]|uniref:3-hydroxyacyl-CoA dehydrogenase n=1 Tax=Phaeovulum vinaykumarii TaxID=407234 RepID=A0A1N7JZ56_9RHOB|nr:3-hydroxyacyl-CoA dehydrogenase NAD-binding domain-containing protein [Phaeovulum vinaykumarii]SIS54612.1 3-hydroxyacyl-CoA dehydrogenase [Phaeovulum vinaykumarii]SOB92003.1 3-hydroxyacyl-CoA dehydrogenase [Phaeovulum vinaykumarii]